MKLINTSDPSIKPSILMLIYGEGGIGKTTFGATAPAPIIADCENGAKYFGMRGISCDIGQIEKWPDMKDFLLEARKDKYQTIVIDPIGELMDKLKMYMIGLNDRKLVQTDGSPTMAGWGWLKKTMRDYLKVLRDTGKNVIIVAHVEEKQDDNRLVKRPKVETKLSDELVALVDIVGYMTMVNDGGQSKRVVLVDSSSDRYIAKDRTGQLGGVIPPEFSQIVNAVNGTESYKWAKEPKTAQQAQVTPKVAQPVAPAPKATPAPVLEQQHPIQAQPEPANPEEEMFCSGCGEIINKWTNNYSLKIYGAPFCRECQSITPRIKK